MSKTPSSDPRYSCSPNPGDSSEDSEQLEVDSCRIVSPVREEDETSSDSERTASFGQIPGDGHGHIMEADSGYIKAGDQDARSDAQEVIRLQGKTGFLKILPPMNNKLVGGTSYCNVMSKNTQMDGETDGKTLLSNTKLMTPLPRVKHQKEHLTLPRWFTDDYTSEVADLDGWEHVQVPRADYSGRKDKYYTHRDYAHTFRSKIEVEHFLKTGEVKGKGLLQKKSADPSAQGFGPRRSTKRRMEVSVRDPIEKPQGFSWSTRGEMASNSSKLPYGFV